MESNKYILVRFSELSLKGGNKKEFVRVLIKNIKNKLKDNEIKAEIKDVRDKLKIFSSQLNLISLCLKEIVGISSFSFCVDTAVDKTQIENIIKKELSSLPSKTTFRVSAKIINNDMFENKDKMIEWLAWIGTNKLGLKINLKYYDIDINVRIENKIATLFFKKETTINGLPAGVNGKALTLLSGGIDSPVAAFKIITRGINSSFIIFLTPRTSEFDTISKIKDLAKQVDKFNGNHGKLFFVNFEKVQEEIMKLDDDSYRIILLRRYFMRFSELVSRKYGYKFLVTGDVLGQVASQTPESMEIIDQTIKKLIIRPLVSMTKNEIIKDAEAINTYKISIRPGDDMCSAFTPKKPIIFPKLYRVKELELQLGDMDNILEKVFNEDMRVINIKELKNE
ncbi:MAG: tRNA 4-thiouridine(8) synthase ThiI [Mycoplasmataceae bacterium]|nr:tRNA 4-thiouridine(8) synthase ThiI [Mycoplasmataceae bacterium]